MESFRAGNRSKALLKSRWMQGASQRGRQCCATPHLFLQFSLLSEVPDFPPAHLPAAAVTVAMGFAAITLAGASIVLPYTAMAVSVTAPAVCRPDSTGTG